jgi:uncharacterized damage-inducible protein DinB
MTAQEVRTYIGYSSWASRKVLEAALALPPEDRAKPMSVSHESIANTLALTSISETQSGFRGLPTPAIRCRPSDL